MFSNTLSADQNKKNIHDSQDLTKKTSILLLFAFLVTFFHLILSLTGVSSEWKCEIDVLNSKHDTICNKLLRTASCRSLKGPIRAEILLDVQNEAKISAVVVCPWENAMSELRICFDIGCLLTIAAGLVGMMRESKYLAELSINASYFFGLLLGITSVFDFFAIQDSKVDNFFLCSWSDEVNLGNGVTKEHLDCSYSLYNFTALWGGLTVICLWTASYVNVLWKKGIVFD